MVASIRRIRSDRRHFERGTFEARVAQEIPTGPPFKHCSYLHVRSEGGENVLGVYWSKGIFKLSQAPSLPSRQDLERIGAPGRLEIDLESTYAIESFGD